MLNDKVIRTAFLISFVGHYLFLSMPGIDVESAQLKKLEDVIVRIEIEKPSLLPKIDVMGEEKKLKEIVEKLRSAEVELEPKPQPEEVVMVQPIKEPIEEDIEVVDPAQEAMLRYQDMVKQRIEEVRRYPSWAKQQEIEGAVHLNFVVLSNGLSRETKIIHSSGSKLLDQEAVATIQRANPFPPIPQQINQDFATMEVIVVFALN